MANQAADGDRAEVVKQQELARFAAMVRGDADGLAALLSEDLTYHHSNGGADTKSSWLAGKRASETRFISISPSDLQVRVFGTTAIITGVLCGVVQAQVGGPTRSGEARYTSVWVESEGRWKMVACQSARLLSQP
jgi:ketosteroid isomerase-like protein